MLVLCRMNLFRFQLGIVLSCCRRSLRVDLCPSRRGDVVALTSGEIASWKGSAGDLASAGILCDPGSDDDRVKSGALG